MGSISKLLLLSNSTWNGEYLHIWKRRIQTFLGQNEVQACLFIPFAGVTIGWAEYTEKVRNALPNYRVIGLNEATDMIEAVRNAETIIIGGGNTFHLLHHLQMFDLLTVIREKVLNGTPYIGWSAGSNVAGPDIGTTNDMPIIWPKSGQALNLIPYNINPHYSEFQEPNFNGEGRADRLKEFLAINKRQIIALPECTGIHVNGQNTQIIAAHCEVNVPKVWYNSENGPKCEVLKFDENIDLNGFR